MPAFENAPDIMEEFFMPRPTEIESNPHFEEIDMLIDPPSQIPAIEYKPPLGNADFPERLPNINSKFEKVPQLKEIEMPPGSPNKVTTEFEASVEVEDLPLASNESILNDSVTNDSQRQSKLDDLLMSAMENASAGTKTAKENEAVSEAETPLIQSESHFPQQLTAEDEIEERLEGADEMVFADSDLQFLLDDSLEEAIIESDRKKRPRENDHDTEIPSSSPQRINVFDCPLAG